MAKKKITQNIVLAGVIAKGGEILVLKRSKNQDVYPNVWELPSGKRKFLEPSEAALIREIKEETGLDVEALMAFSVFDYRIERSNEIKDSTQINFLVKPKGNTEVRLSSEHQSFAWINKDEIDKYDFTDETKKVLKKVFRLLTLLKENYG